MIFVIVASVISLAAGHFDFPGRPSIEDLKKFYRVGQITYLVQRTYRGQVPICIHNKVHNVTNGALNFYQSYTYTSGGITVSVSLPVNIKLSRGGGYDDAPFMKAVSNTFPRMTRNYYFHYYDDNAHCAVLTFKDYSGTLRCELHTWKTTASYTLYGNCLEEYKYQCPGRKSHSIFLSDCPNAV